MSNGETAIVAFHVKFENCSYVFLRVHIVHKIKNWDKRKTQKFEAN